MLVRLFGLLLHQLVQLLSQSKQFTLCLKSITKLERKYKMKKFITMMVVALVAVSASAATFAWGTGSTKVSFNGTNITTANGAIGYLVLLTGSSLEASVVEGIMQTPTAISTKANISTGLASAKGRISGSYASDSIANGQNYGMFITYSDGTDTWYNFSSTVYTVSGLQDATSGLEDAVFAFDFATQTTVTDGDAVTAGGGWYKAVAVPEPASAMLALAGVAMLIRRRK
jgi:hypothetical protein